MFYLIDKPIGISSFDVIRKLRKTLGIKKMGHAGTLDPLATGCLLIATEKSTKLLPLLDNSEKEYIFTVRLDGKSDSLDCGTPIESVDTSAFIERNTKDLETFLLNQKEQIPPNYCALHIDGKRAYDMARSGEIFTINSRKISVSAVEILEHQGYSTTCKMQISSGGYIRSFAPVIAGFFSIQGGYIEKLRRTKIYVLGTALSHTEAGSIDAPREIPYSKLFHTIPTFDIGLSEYTSLLNGCTLKIESQDKSQYPDGLIFLRYNEVPYISLCRNYQGIVTIVKNDV